MNLYDIITNYKTTPSEELIKIDTILNRKYIYTSFWGALGDYFTETPLAKYESDLNAFYKKFVINCGGHEFQNNQIKCEMQYRFKCEFFCFCLKITNIMIGLLILGVMLHN